MVSEHRRPAQPRRVSPGIARAASSMSGGRFICVFPSLLTTVEYPLDAVGLPGS